MLSSLTRLLLTAAVLVDRLQRRLAARLPLPRARAEAGQATAEYALVLLGAAAIVIDHVWNALSEAERRRYATALLFPADKQQARWRFSDGQHANRHGRRSGGEGSRIQLRIGDGLGHGHGHVSAPSEWDSE